MESYFKRKLIQVFINFCVCSPFSHEKNIDQLSFVKFPIQRNILLPIRPDKSEINFPNMIAVDICLLSLFVLLVAEHNAWTVDVSVIMLHIVCVE